MMAGLLKFDYSVVLELRSCSILIAMHEMHGQLIITNVTTPLPLYAVAESGGGVEFKGY